MLQSATTASDLIERINHLGEDDVRNDILMRRLLNSAKILVENANARAVDYIALGALYTLQGNSGQMCRTFTQAIHKFPDNPDLLLNYAISLSGLNMLAAAHIQIIQAARLKPGDKLILDKLIHSCVALGRFREAWTWLAQWHQYYPDTAYEQADTVSVCYAIVLQHDIADRNIQQLTEIAYALLRAKQLYRYRSQLNAQQNVYSSRISFQIGLDLPDAEVFALGNRLVEKFATENIDPVASHKFIIRLVPEH
jgi:tetratricopeptide (TPR) repeat protein